MGERSKIEWCDSTWPVVQGCDPVSPGCTNCYAVPLVHRLAWNTNPKISAPIKGVVEHHKDRLRFTGKVALREDRMDWPLKWKKGRMIFVPSHGDLFHEDVPDAFIDRVFAVMALTSQHTYQVLTKRAERMLRYMEHSECEARWMNAVANLFEVDRTLMNRCYPIMNRREPWLPLPNAWLGVSAEDQQRADERIPLLLQTPAAVRFVSLEPLLGPIDLSVWPRRDWLRTTGYDGAATQPGLDWVIVGGESGPGPHARPMHPDWARSLRDQCAAADVPYFFKQWGEFLPVGQHLPGFGKIHGATVVKPGRMKLHYGGTPKQTPQHAFAENGVAFTSIADGRLTFRVGKRAAGRLLDGREWNGMPEGNVVKLAGTRAG
jgi:protein gp37